MAKKTKNILIIYWGRRGVNSFVIETARELLARRDIDVTLSISTCNADLTLFAPLGRTVVPVEIFKHNWGAANLVRLFALRREMVALIKERKITDVVTLMPHVWSHAMSSAYQAAGARYHTIIHDAVRHPGDGTGLMLPLLLWDTRGADTVLALSDGVAKELLRQRRVDETRLRTLFHPVPRGTAAVLATPAEGQPWRFLFLGRIMAYKGLPLFAETMALLRAEGHSVELSVLGEGAIDVDTRGLLDRLGAHIVNRWLSETEIADALRCHHAMVLSHIEASQSGVAASALGAGLPIIATPVGGLTQQIRHGETGLLAREVSASSLAETARELMRQHGLHARLAAGAALARAGVSASAFVDSLLEAIG